MITNLQLKKIRIQKFGYYALNKLDSGIVFSG